MDISTYNHQVTSQLQVRDLREALEGLSDDLPVLVNIPAGPTTLTLGTPGERLVITGATSPIPGLDDHAHPLVLLADYPSGTYRLRPAVTPWMGTAQPDTGTTPALPGF